jgi:hypothetical protein
LRARSAAARSWRTAARSLALDTQAIALGGHLALGRLAGVLRSRKFVEHYGEVHARSRGVLARCRGVFARRLNVIARQHQVRLGLLKALPVHHPFLPRRGQEHLDLGQLSASGGKVFPLALEEAVVNAEDHQPLLQKYIR